MQSLKDFSNASKEFAIQLVNLLICLPQKRWRDFRDESNPRNILSRLPQNAKSRPGQGHEVSSPKKGLASLPSRGGWKNSELIAPGWLVISLKGPNLNLAIEFSGWLAVAFAFTPIIQSFEALLWIRLVKSRANLSEFIFEPYWYT